MDNIDLTKHIRILGYLAIAISIVTWAIDLAGIVYACPYCRIERTAIGAIGLIMVFPHYRYFSIYFTILLGFMGLSVASAQLFMHFDRMKFTFMFSGLAVAAMFIMVAQILLVLDRARRHETSQ